MIHKDVNNSSRIFALHKMRTTLLLVASSFDHLVYGSRRYGDDEKRMCIQSVRGCANYYERPRTRMNETESVVILILWTRLRKWLIDEARVSHVEFSFKRVCYSSPMRDTDELWSSWDNKRSIKILYGKIYNRDKRKMWYAKTSFHSVKNSRKMFLPLDAIKTTPCI